ncbi:hypothetical protein ES703_22534 [subsurface metagenome]
MKVEMEKVEMGREQGVTAKYRQPKGVWRGICVVFPVAVIGVSIFYLFRLTFFGRIFITTSYLYLLMALLLPLVFLFFPSSSRGRRDTVPWFDVLGAVLVFAIPFYFCLRGWDIMEQAMEVAAPQYMLLMSLVLLLLVVECGRRTVGLIFTIVCVFFGLFPLFANYVPAPLTGLSLPFWRVVSFHALGPESIAGLPMRVVGTLLIGFLIFAVVLMGTGGGRFFLNCALALFGRFRGGAAKVAVFASGLFGSMSGSVITNVLTTGSITIPAMKQTGYPAHYAAAVEACASTGGVLMPPIMGAAAFLIAEFLGMPYSYVMIAAFLPSILYYLGLFAGVDAFAAKSGLKGLPQESLPNLKETLKEGWFFLVALLLLVYLLLVTGWQAQAPYYVAAFLLILSTIHKGTRLSPRGLVQLLEQMGRVLAEITAILCTIGLILGSLTITGTAFSLSSDIIRLAGGSIPLLLLLGFATSFILGMGMTVTACYIFLAIILAPGLIGVGLNPLAVHLFIMYCGMISYITPPVAIGAFAAAGLAGSAPMKTGFQAMRLGIVIYFIPFFF